jgi:hypothetical protein
MAYSNWGAFVNKDGKRRQDREDVAVFNDDEKDVPSGARIFANLIKNREKYGEGEEGIKATPWHEHSHHAVLGDGPVRLAGYKCHPELYVMNPDGTIETKELPDICYPVEGELHFGVSYYYDKEKYPDAAAEFTDLLYKDYEIKIRHFDDNKIELYMKEPDGSVWTSTCGFEYGAGWMD